MIQTPSKIKLTMMVENHPQLEVYTHIANRIEQVFRNPKKVRKYFARHAIHTHSKVEVPVITIPLVDILSADMQLRLGRDLSENGAPIPKSVHYPGVLTELVLFLQGETGLSVYCNYGALGQSPAPSWYDYVDTLAFSFVME